jgi:two-component system chemotaxis response regulator CheY
MKRKILVIDDSRTIRQQVKATFEKESYQVEEAEDGAQGLAALDKIEGIALIVADVNMPIMDGLTMVEKIKAKGTHTKIPIVMLTTEGSPEAIARAKAAGVKGWLVKPYKPEQLLLTAKKLIV